jgi:hypothetical protein
VAIQTKTSSAGSKFRLSEADEQPGTEHEWYVFVGLKGQDERPEFYVVPRGFVSAFIFVGHRKWLATPGKKGQRKNTAIRSIHGAWIKDFLDAWDLLERPASEVCTSHDAHILEDASRLGIGLQNDHPWQTRLTEYEKRRTAAYIGDVLDDAGDPPQVVSSDAPPDG